VIFTVLLIYLFFSQFIVGSECINWFSEAVALFEAFGRKGFTAIYQGAVHHEPGQDAAEHGEVFQISGEQAKYIIIILAR
jgi:hypothetical protein